MFQTDVDIEDCVTRTGELEVALDSQVCPGWWFEKGKGVEMDINRAQGSHIERPRRRVNVHLP